MNLRRRLHIAPLCLSCIILALGPTACNRENPLESWGTTKATSTQTVISNGRIYTANTAEPWVEAIVIGDGKLVYVGDNSGAEKYRGKDVLQLDMGGRMLMPGINDGHAHPWQGGVKTLYNCNFPFTATPEIIAQKLRECITANPDDLWLIGGQWTSDFFNNYDMPSPRKWLDNISSEHPIYLSDDATHNAWVNSKALALAGIDRNSPDPEGGAFLRDREGELNGLLYEHARRPVLAVIPDWTEAQYHNAMAEALGQANRFGLTGVNEARAEPKILQAYRKLDETEGLTVHLVANIQTPREYRDYPLDIESIVATRDEYTSPHLHTGFVKIFLDGVPTASRTALMLQDYLVDPEHPEQTRGHLMVAADVLKKDLIALDKAGIAAKIHAAGDGSVRLALDAIAAAREANGDSGLPHQLAHAGFIDPVDIPRFSTLNVTVDLSPYIWYPSPIIDSVQGAIGERGLRYFPVRQLLQSGAKLMMGSDWPSAAKDLSPWHAIEALVTRQNPFTNSEESLWPEQAVTLQQALAIATLGGAKAMRLDGLTGSIEVGKSADFIVLDKNLFEIPETSISDTEVEQTWFEGKLVYSKR